MLQVTNSDLRVSEFLFSIRTAISETNSDRRTFLKHASRRLGFARLSTLKFGLVYVPVSPASTVDELLTASGGRVVTPHHHISFASPIRLRYTASARI